VIREIVFRTEAELDISQAAEWYESRGEGLSSEFRRVVEACIASIQRNPLQYPRIYGDYRRAALRRFPFGIFYRVGDNEIVIAGCYHARRDPKSWKGRL
jgi:plasmid stabilization system protein ParE